MDTAESVDTLVLGGGLVGLASAWHLRRAGVDVAVVAPEHVGMASRAAVGMLTPGCEWNGYLPRHFLELMVRGRDYYPAFLAELTGGVESDGFGVCYRRTDYLYLDSVERDEQMARHHRWLAEAGLDVEHIGLEETLAREPGLDLSTVRGSLRITGDAVVDPRALVDVLRAALLDVLVQDMVTAVAERGGRFVVTTADGAAHTARRLVLAAGAWTRELAAAIGLDIPVAPIRGQIIELHGDPGAVRTILYVATGACGSVVERRPGVYLVGTSEEGTSVDAVTTPRVVGAVLSRVCSLVPALGSMHIADMWAGFRPTTPDELPVIGTAFDDRVVVATGHYRNGVLLGPYTGALVRDLVTGAVPPLDLTPYRPDRAYGKQYRLANRY